MEKSKGASLILFSIAIILLVILAVVVVTYYPRFQGATLLSSVKEIRITAAYVPLPPLPPFIMHPPVDVESVGGNLYTVKNGLLYRIDSKDNKTLIQIKGLSGISNANGIGENGIKLDSDGKLVYAIMSQVVGGFCGDAKCMNITLYYITNDSAIKIISGISRSTANSGVLYQFVNAETNIISEYYIDKRGNLYTSLGSTLVIVRDGKIIGKVSNIDPTMPIAEIDMFSDDNNTYIVISKSGSYNASQNNVQREYKIGVPN